MSPWFPDFPDIDKPKPQDPDTVPTQFINRVVLRVKEHNCFKAFDWCRENVDSIHQFDMTSGIVDLEEYYVRIYSFAKKEDAMAFKLRWM